MKQKFIAPHRAGYRPEIDGLRAIAVMGVVLFHLDVALFGGGYLGVDVFFVISGYLITQLIKREFDSTGRIDFAQFYVRRARRLLPALLATLIFSFLIGVALFTPQHLERFAQAVLSAVFSFSNFFFWQESGYFDAAAKFKPALHTWSLGVEEQFYLVWPVLLYLLLKQVSVVKIRLIALVSIIAGIALNILFMRVVPDALAFPESGFLKSFNDSSATTFFLLPFRVYEFAIGALLVWLPRERLSSSKWCDAWFLIGLICVIAPMMAPHLGGAGIVDIPAGVVPSIGAALIICAGNAPKLGRLLSNRLTVLIGAVSYSLYLVHWPIVVFYKYYVFRELLAVEKVALFFVMLGVAMLSYRFVEARFRFAKQKHADANTARFLAGCAVAAFLLVAPAIHAAVSHGWPGRINPELLRIVTEEIDAGKKTDGYATACSDGWGRCVFGDGRLKVLAIGDSHMKQYSAYFEEAGLDATFTFITSAACYFGASYFTYDYKRDKLKRRSCLDHVQLARAELQKDEYDVLLIGQRWIVYQDRLVEGDKRLQFDEDEEFFDAVFSDYLPIIAAGRGRPVIIIGNTPKTNNICLLRPAILNKGCLTGYADTKEHAINAYFEARSKKEAGYLFINPEDYLCENNECLEFDDGMIFADDSHLSKKGSAFVGDGIVKALHDEFGL